MEVARGERGPAPQTITFLSGDVHNSYLAEVTDPLRLGAQSRVVQAVCSPIRNPMPRGVRMVVSLFAKSLVRPMRFIASRSPDVPEPRLPVDGHRRALVRQQHRPGHAWATSALALSWVTGVVEDDEATRGCSRCMPCASTRCPRRLRVGSGAVQG